MSEASARRLVTMFGRISAAIEAEKETLCELDGAIGDADHGISMSLGFTSVNGELGRLDLRSATVSEVFTAAASAFLNAVGASTGPLYATGFLLAAQRPKCEAIDTACGQAAMIEAIAAGIQKRGKAQRGDKTMLDVWLPAAEAAGQAAGRGADVEMVWREVLEAADLGALATRSMIATKGRAARVGERALGHLDPGAASAVMILQAMSDTFCRADAGRERERRI